MKRHSLLEKNMQRFDTITSCHHQTENVYEQLKYVSIT